jgi:hypothetical protein
MVSVTNGKTARGTYGHGMTIGVFIYGLFMQSLD